MSLPPDPGLSLWEQCVPWLGANLLAIEYKLLQLSTTNNTPCAPGTARHTHRPKCYDAMCTPRLFGRQRVTCHERCLVQYVIFSIACLPVAFPSDSSILRLPSSSPSLALGLLPQQPAGRRCAVCIASRARGADVRRERVRLRAEPHHLLTLRADDMRPEQPLLRRPLRT